MPVIDAHVHLYPPELARDPEAWAAAHREPHWAALCTRRRKDGRGVQDFPSLDGLLRAMDATGIERSILLGWYWENHPSCAAQNRFYAECVRRHPDRLAAFATVHPAAGEAALEELRRAREDGLRGLGEMSPHSQGFAADDPVWLRILDLAGELGLPVNLHVTDPASRPYPGRVETPLADFVLWARTHPRTRFVLAHWGGGLAFDSEMRALSNVQFDTAASPLLYGPEAWGRGVKAVGADRILFGSDFPLVLYPARETEASVAGLLAEARAQLASGAQPPVLGGNAAARWR